MGQGTRAGRLIYALAAALVAGGVLWFAVSAIGSDDFGNARDDYPLFAVALGGALALVGWWLSRRIQRAAEDAEQKALASRDEAERAHERERELRERLEQCRRREHEWARELHDRLAELHEQRGALADVSDVRELVLRTAIALVGADKGLLLSREDSDSDGDLDLVCAVDFEHDPEQSALAQHFARQVIQRDETVRADDPAELVDGDRTPADAEIENLVAIPIWMRDRFAGVVVCANRTDGFDDLDDEVLLALGAQAGAALAGARLRGELRGAFLATVRVLADAIEAHDRELRVHSNEVAKYVAEVAGRIGLDPRRREEVVFASLLHDVGKIGVSDRILLKPAALTPDERLVVELHAKIGHRLIEQIPQLSGVATAVLHHHERWDGDGYPAKLRGDDIPLEARLIGIADAFSAMLSERPYRAAMSVEAASAELKRCAGTQFDPTLVRLFVEEIKRNPPSRDGSPDPLAEALEEPDVALRRSDDERLLGEAAFSVVDNLTLLFGHRYLHDAARSEADRAGLQGRPFAVFIACVEGLAELNRDRGYAAGDDALREAADAVQRVAGRCAGTAARESGSRIALLVPGASSEIADALGQELEVELNGQEVPVTWAVWEPGDSGDDVIAKARRDRAPAEIVS